MTSFETIVYDTGEEGIAKVVLNRPEVRNAQNRQLTYELNDAFDLAAKDDSVHVIVLSGAGPHFSAGHDLRDNSSLADFETIGTWGGFGLPGVEGFLALEEEIYLGMCKRWRDIPKPTIAQVQGKVIAGALMLVWVCDLIIASDDASFSDPVSMLGMCGVEYFAHPWEFGPRKAKELLFTGDSITANEAAGLGMVNHVVPRDELEDFTLSLARRIAKKSTMAMKLAKLSVNGTLDAQGQGTALANAFALHQLNHSHNQQRFGYPMDPTNLPDMFKDVDKLGVKPRERGW